MSSGRSGSARWEVELRADALTHHSWEDRARHFAYATGWKKFEPLWNFVIRARRVAAMRPTLETILRGTGKRERAATPCRTGLLACPPPLLPQDVAQIAPTSRVSSIAP